MHKWNKETPDNMPDWSYGTRENMEKYLNETMKPPENYEKP